MAVTDTELAAFIEPRALVNLYRDAFDDREIQTIPIAFSRELLHAHVVSNLRIDGQLVVRRQDISAMDIRVTDRFHRARLADAGCLDGLEFAPAIDLRSFATAIDSLPPESTVILEDEDLDEPLWMIGRHLRTQDQSIWIREFNGVAGWDDHETIVHAGDVTCMQVEKHYIRVYDTYLRDRPPPPLSRGNATPSPKEP